MKLTGFKRFNLILSISLIVCLLGGTTYVSAGYLAGDEALGGVSYFLEKYYENVGNDDEGASGALLADVVTIPENVAIAKVNDYVNIRSGAGTSYGVVGYLPKNGMCTVLELTEDNSWAKIESGAVTGYVSCDYLYTGEEGRKKAEELAKLMATVNAGTVNFRSTPDTVSDDNILATVTNGEALVVIEETVVNKDDETTLWVKAYLDDMEGYIAKRLVTVAYDWVRAVSMTSIVGADSASNLSSLRAAIVIEAKKHIGLKYVWGGNSLKTGADCSGFCLAVYRAVGISTKNMPRTSTELASCSKGKKVSLSSAKPGDLVFYGDKSGHVNHVAIYIGNGQIIHESGRKTGCKISSVNYRTVLKIKNFID